LYAKATKPDPVTQAALELIARARSQASTTAPAKAR
jgi:hypothetical protein